MARNLIWSAVVVVLFIFSRNVYGLDCSIYTNCVNCTNVPSCGWCGYENKCITGGTNGPWESCAGLWLYYPEECNDPCLGNRTCAQCARQPECGWCATLSSCRTGGPSGPAFGAGCQSWVPQNCTDCAQQTSCSACTLYGGCAWCGNRCIEGGLGGPVDTNVTCASYAYASLNCLTEGTNRFLFAILVPIGFVFGIVLPVAICLRLRYSASEPFPYLRVHGGSGSGAESPLRTQPAARASRQDYTTALTDADTPDVRTNATVLVPPAPQSLHRRASAAAGTAAGAAGSLPSS